MACSRTGSCFVRAAIYIHVCHFCAKTRLMRQPWNISLSGYNISKLPRSRTRRIAVSGRGSAVQDTISHETVHVSKVAGPVSFHLSLSGSLGHCILGLQLIYVMRVSNRSLSLEWAHLERVVRLCPVSRCWYWSQCFGPEIDT